MKNTNQIKYNDTQKNTFFYMEKDKSQIAIFQRMSRKYLENVYVKFKLPVKSVNNSGAVGFCLPAEESYRNVNAYVEPLPIVTEQHGKLRGCKIYKSKSNVPEEQFKEQIHVYYEKYRSFELASSSQPIFFIKDGVLHGLIHTFYAEGVNLYSYLNENELTYTDKLVLIRLIVAMLEKKLYSRAIEHGDLKLENIIFNEKNQRMTLIDVDMCRKFGERAVEKGTSCNRPPIIKDEKILLELEQCGYYDVFALGMLMMDILQAEIINPVSIILAYEAEVDKNIQRETPELFGQNLLFNSEQQDTACELIYEWFPEFEKHLSHDNLPEEVGIKAQESFKDQWCGEYPDYENLKELDEVVRHIFQLSFQKFKKAYEQRAYLYNEKNYSISAYSYFGIQNLENVLILADIGEENRNKLYDAIVRSQLANPEIAPTIPELLGIIEEVMQQIFKKYSSDSLPEFSNQPTGNSLVTIPIAS
ncbi:MAG: protein kinase family protein [Legionellales bacterium]|nr:protein kinase family protein [Legionellales bacterium]